MNEPAHPTTPRVPRTSQDAIDAEIADHLASAAQRLAAQGTPPEAAQLAAHQQFGDVDAIRRRCFWIQEGKSIIFRTTVLVLLIGLSVGLTVTAIGTWQTQSRLVEQVTALTEQLKLLAENQQAAAPHRPPSPSRWKSSAASMPAHSTSRSRTRKSPSSTSRMAPSSAASAAMPRGIIAPGPWPRVTMHRWLRSNRSHRPTIPTHSRNRSTSIQAWG